MKRDGLLMALLACAMASLAHHVHNAAFLEHYPQMPAWLSAPIVYAAWSSATVIGLIGHLAFRGGYRRIGSGLMALYGLYGLDGLVHYALAPLSAHTLAMNVTIGLEASAAAALLLALALPVSSKTR